MSLISLKLTQMSLKYQKLFQHVSNIKIKKTKVINMVRIKRNTHIIHWNIFPFSQNTLQIKSKKDYQIISQIASKNILNKLSKNTTKIRLKSYLTSLPQVCSSKIYICFQKYIARWQLSMVNRQRITPRLTTTFS